MRCRSKAWGACAPPFASLRIEQIRFRLPGHVTPLLRDRVFQQNRPIAATGWTDSFRPEPVFGEWFICSAPKSREIAVEGVLPCSCRCPLLPKWTAWASAVKLAELLAPSAEGELAGAAFRGRSLPQSCRSRPASERLFSSPITALICVSSSRLHLSRKSLGHYTDSNNQRATSLGRSTAIW